MSTRRRLSHPLLPLVVVCGVGVGLLALPDDTSSSVVPYPTLTGPALPEAAVDGWSLRRFGPAANAFRTGGVERARELLAADSRQQSVLLGFYAAQEGDGELARVLLSGAGDPTGLLEDWRLFRLSQLAVESADLPTAQSALAELLAAHPHSPLYLEAYREHLAVAHERGDWLTALRDIEAARQNGLAGPLAAEVDRLEWEILSAHGLEEQRRASARRLLADHPLAASELKVVELFRRDDGELDWRAILDNDALLRRAANLLDVGIVEGALATLDAIHEADRNLDWSLLRARALTADRRGAEALVTLESRPPTPRGRMQEVRWARAEAALEAARVRSGRANAATAERQRFQDQAWKDLWQSAASADRATRIAALHRLYRLADIEEDFELGLDVLKRLRAEDSTDVTGYRDLFKLGWREFERRNTTGAIGIWRELQDLYPETSRARQALYWSAVAHQELGNEERGRDLLLQVVASDTFDFYAVHAARRLGVPPRRVAAVEDESWPDDATLGRAALLSELGLDAMAARELELLAGVSDERAALGLEALILARQGDRRESIQAVWRAFQKLGKPGQSAVPELVRHLYYPAEFEEIIRRWARERGLPPYLVFGIIRQESAFDAGAVSRAGARGLMQLMPATGRELASKLRLPFSRTRLSDPNYSVQLGTRYFAEVLDMFDGDVELALAGYNGGPYRIRRWWREAGPNRSVDRFVEGLSLSETTNYVKRILIHQDSYQQLYGDAH